MPGRGANGGVCAVFCRLVVTKRGVTPSAYLLPLNERLLPDGDKAPLRSFSYLLGKYLGCARTLSTTAPNGRRRVRNRVRIHSTVGCRLFSPHAPCQTKTLPLTGFANGTAWKRNGGISCHTAFYWDIREGLGVASHKEASLPDDAAPLPQSETSSSMAVR